MLGSRGCQALRQRRDVVSGVRRAPACVTRPSPAHVQALIGEEPQDTLCTSTREQTIHIVSSLW